MGMFGDFLLFILFLTLKGTKAKTSFTSQILSFGSFLLNFIKGDTLETKPVFSLFTQWILAAWVTGSILKLVLRLSN